jgi:hypothetical protein
MANETLGIILLGNVWGAIAALAHCLSARFQQSFAHVFRNVVSNQDLRSKNVGAELFEY